MLKRSRSDGTPYTIKHVLYMCICVGLGEIDRKQRDIEKEIEEEEKER